MNIFSSEIVAPIRKKRNIFFYIFLVLTIVFLASYIVSFLSNTLYLPVIIGVVAVLVLVLFYYGLIFDKSKLLKLFKNYSNGITQSATYTFNHFDDETEHDGVKLMRLDCSFEDDGEIFNRTLYFISDLPYPSLNNGQILKVKTYQNIIVYIED